jgi:RNA polymerase sigma-70 factor, ECF subfamily
MTPSLDLFQEHRPLMFSIAYRMLGTITDAEDIVQDAYLRYQTAAQDQIASPKAFFSTVVTRLCLNHLQSARSTRETYIGPWLPEPALTSKDERFAPMTQAELLDSISMAFMVLLEQLTPLERATFLLREVFDYEYAEIAEMLGKDEAACRQLFSRARKHISDNKPRFKADPEAHRALLNRFIESANTGELEPVMELLADDVTMWTDGGGKSRGAALQPIHGQKAVAQFILTRTGNEGRGTTLHIAEVNGEASMILTAQNTVFLILMIDTDGQKISSVRVIGNPDKLAGLNKLITSPDDLDR